MRTETEKAETLDRRRARVAPFLGVVVLSAQQWLFFSRDWDDAKPLQLVLWLILVLIMLAVITTGGLWFSSKKVRQLADDEVTRNSRQKAFQAGFAVAILTALIVFVVSPFEPLSAQRAAHIIISLTLGVTLVVFGVEENRHLG